MVLKCFSPQGTFANTWRHFWLSQLGCRCYMASSRSRPSILLNVWQRTGQPLTSKNYSAQMSVVTRLQIPALDKCQLPRASPTNAWDPGNLLGVPEWLWPWNGASQIQLFSPSKSKEAKQSFPFCPRAEPQGEDLHRAEGMAEKSLSVSSFLTLTFPSCFPGKLSGQKTCSPIRWNVEH